MFRSKSSFETLAAQRSDARELLGPATTHLQDLKAGLEHIVERGSKMAWAGAIATANAARIVGERAHKHRTGLSAATAVLAGGTALVSAALAARNIQIYAPVKGMFEVLAEQPVTTAANSGDVINTVTIGGTTATTSAVAAFCALAFKRGKQIDHAYATNPHLPKTPFSAPRPVTDVPREQMSDQDFLSKANYHRARADILDREGQTVARKTLLAEIVEAFDGTPAPTSTVYYSETYQPGLTQTQAEEFRPPVLPTVAEHLDIHTEIAGMRNRFNNLVVALETPATTTPAELSASPASAVTMSSYVPSRQLHPVAA